MAFQPASLLELSARVIKNYGLPFEHNIPHNLVEYLHQARSCLNPRCSGVYFDARVEHVKFVDFCGMYRSNALYIWIQSVQSNCVFSFGHFSSITTIPVFINLPHWGTSSSGRRWEQQNATRSTRLNKSKSNLVYFKTAVFLFSFLWNSDGDHIFRNSFDSWHVVVQGLIDFQVMFLANGIVNVILQFQHELIE